MVGFECDFVSLELAKEVIGRANDVLDGDALVLEFEQTGSHVTYRIVQRLVN